MPLWQNRQDSLLIGWFVHFNQEMTELAAEKMTKKFCKCANLIAVPPAESAKHFYKSNIHFDMNMSINEQQMADLQKHSGAKYAITGQLVDRNLNGTMIDVFTAYEMANPLPGDNLWVNYRFKVHDLEHQKVILTLNTRFEADYLDYADNEGDVWRFQLLPKRSLPRIALRKSLRKLGKRFDCKEKNQAIY